MRRVMRLESVTCAAAVVIALLAGCDSASRDAFRDAASDHFETAINDVLQGVADGVFEVVDPSPGQRTSP